MAKQTETTKRAAVWNPPRLHNLYLTGVMSGGRMHGDWEGSKEWSPGPNASPTVGYRMPTSAEPVPFPYPWQ